MEKTDVSFQEFKSAFKVDLDTGLEQVAISSLKEQHSMQEDEAKKYFDILIEENEIKPSDEEIWEEKLKNQNNEQNG